MATQRKSLHGRQAGIGDNGELLLNGMPVSRAPGTDRFVSAGSATTLTTDDAGRIVKLDTATGSVVTLPTASGTGNKYHFVVSVLATTNSHKIQVNSTADAMQGMVIGLSATAANAVAFSAAAGTDDTITLNRSTTGSVVIGEQFEVTDFAANRYHVHGIFQSTGTTATPFSNAV
jgi:hypothetical protein